MLSFDLEVSCKTIIYFAGLFVFGRAALFFECVVSLIGSILNMQVPERMGIIQNKIHKSGNIIMSLSLSLKGDLSSIPPGFS